MKIGDVKDYAILGALGVVAFVAYRWLNKVPDALNAVGSKIGTGAADFRDWTSELLFGPQWSMHFFTVNFAGAERHAIPVKSQEFPDGVDKNGLFTFRGKRFRIRIKNLPNGKIEYWAFNP